MADVRPFSAIVYRHDVPDISTKTAPPYDVVSPDLRAELLDRDSLNVVALELPEGPLDPAVPGNRYETGAARWNEWRESGVLVADEPPAIYVLEQVWEHAGKTVSRRGFVAAVKLEPFSAGIVLPHERTLPKALDDRFNLIRATHANFSPVLGLFSDPERTTDALFDTAIASAPALTAVDADGVTASVYAIRDAGGLARLSSLLAEESIFIADGHHRYTTALAYRDERRQSEPGTADERPDAPGYDFVLMALVNMDDPRLNVLPTHRVADAAGTFDAEAFWAGLVRNFELRDIDGHPRDALAAEVRPAFVVKTRDGRLVLARLRDGIDPNQAIAGGASSAWKSLDVAVLQELILDPLLGIHPDRPETLERLTFVKDAHKALEQVGDHDVAFIMNPTRMSQLREVALGGEIMPQKSTYFYPKLPSGLLFRDLG